jgi:hypothetical protein
LPPNSKSKTTHQWPIREKKTCRILVVPFLQDESFEWHFS